MKRDNDNRLKGIVGTIAIHLLALLAILIFALSTPLPLPGEEGVEVNLGYSDQGMGKVQKLSPPPAEQSTPPAPQPENDPEPQTEEEIITQDAEEAPAIEEEVAREPAPEAKPVIKDLSNEEPELLDDEIIPDQVIDNPDPVQTVNKQALYPGKSNSDTDGDGSNQGITGQPGDQGKPTGTPDSDNYDGTGKGNEGIGFDLSGRGAKHLPEPAYTSQEQGDVVVRIIVDRNGNVIDAYKHKGTTITDSKLINDAIEAAKHSKFTEDPNALERQVGYITYKFRRLN